MPQASRLSLPSLSERLERARRSGLHVAVVVPLSCPNCGHRPVRTVGNQGGVRYVTCSACNQNSRAVFAEPGEVEVLPRGAEHDSATLAEPDSLVDETADGETVEMVRRSLAGWKLRLAAVRTERRLGAGLEPLAADMAALVAVLGDDESSATEPCGVLVHADDAFEAFD